MKTIIFPQEPAKEAAIVKGLEVIGVEDLIQVIEYLNCKIKIESEEINIDEILKKEKQNLLDFSEVKGQELTKRALEIAAAGGHNCLMIGTPGSGKTMLSRRMPTILPNLTFEEALEITKIHSIAGILKEACLVSERPFRSPHHTISEIGLIGGGRIPKPGEISLAHLGILFLDELLEFNKNTLEVLRGPMEDRVVNISRAGINVSYPCNFMMVASMNPCPCGYYGSKIKECICTQSQRERYKAKLSGPMLDRFDIHIQVYPVNYEEMGNRVYESSREIQKRVNKAKEMQVKRYKEYLIYSNAELTPRLIEKFCKLDKRTEDILNNSFKALNLSARAYYKILKVARTIADLEEKENIEEDHISEAIQYRSLDKDKR